MKLKARPFTHGVIPENVCVFPKRPGSQRVEAEDGVENREDPELNFLPGVKETLHGVE